MSPIAPPSLSVQNAAGNALVISIGGQWSLQESAPSFDEVAPHLESTPPPSQVRFSMEELGTYDSSLVSLLVAVARCCNESGIKLDPGGIPEGVRQLLKIALAVPERKTHEAPDRELFFTRLGKAGLTLGSSMVELLTFIGLSAISFGRLLRGKAVFRVGDTWLIIQRAGAEALPIVTLINFLIGVILGFVGGMELQLFGAAIYMADLVGIAMVRELGCIMTAIIMSGRTGAAFAAEIGSMKVNQEVDALRTLGFSPMEFLVMPRMLALILMMPLLTAYGNVMGMLGGGLLAPLFDISFQQYYDRLIVAIDLTNYSAGIIKAVIFGVIVAGAGCMKGMQSGNSASAVGQATTSAVVTAITAVIAVDAIFAFLLGAPGL
jgi:phospholipid/cholesterol/gamma-HCH transport system permease protein